MVKHTAALDGNKIKSDFPVLSQEINGKALVYLDNAATSQKPQPVIDAINSYYSCQNSNVHRGIHQLSQKATDAYEAVREKARAFINASSTDEVLFTRGTTESLNLLAYTIATKLKPGDEIILSEMEHHSNIVPWQMLCERIGARIKVIPVDEKGDLELEQYEKLLNNNTKVVSVTHISNTLGTVNPIKKIIEKAQKHNAWTIIDGAQAVPHMAVDVQELGCDFYCFSAHKMFGPTGVGVLYGRKELLNELPPYHGGGNMIHKVTFTKTTYHDLPHKFEAGTPNIAGVIGLGAAIDYIEKTGIKNIGAYEKELLDYAIDRLQEIDQLTFIGTSINRAGVISFLLNSIHPFDTGAILDQLGIAVRTGHHCNQPLMEKFGIQGTVRASFAFYNTKDDADALINGLEKAKTLLS